MIAKSTECSTAQGCTVERDLKTASAKGEKALGQEIMSLETLALKRDPLSDDDVLRAASTANELAELVKARVRWHLRCEICSSSRLARRRGEPLACSNNKNSEILNFRIRFRISKPFKTRIFNVFLKI